MQRTVTLMVVVLATMVIISGPAGFDDAAALRVVAIDGTADPSFDVIVAVPRDLSAEAIGSEAFSAAAGEQALDVQAIALPDDRLDIVLMLDPSLLQPETRTDVVGAATEFVIGLPAGARVAIDEAGLALTGQGDLTRDRAATLSALEALEGGRPTPRGRVRPLVNVLRSDRNRRPAMVVVSAGPAATVEADLAASRPDVPIYAIVLDEDRDEVLPIERPGVGMALSAGVHKLVAALDIVTADLTGQYQLTFRLPERAPRTVGLRVEWRGVAAATTVALDLERTPAPAPGGSARPADVSDPPGGDGQDQERTWLRWLVAAVAIAAVGTAMAQLRYAPIRHAGGGRVGVTPTGERGGNRREQPATGRTRPAPDRPTHHPGRPVVALVGTPVAEALGEALRGTDLHLEVPTSALDALEQLVREPGAVLVVDMGLPEAGRLLQAALARPISGCGPVFVVGDENDVRDLEVPARIDPASLDQLVADAVHEAIGGQRGAR